MTNLIDNPLPHIIVRHSDTGFGNFDGTFLTNFSNYIRQIGGGHFLINSGDDWTGDFIIYQGWYDNGAGIRLHVGIRPEWFQIVNGVLTYGIVGA